MKQIFALSAVAAALAGLIAGCGSSSYGASSTTTATSASTASGPYGGGTTKYAASTAPTASTASTVVVTTKASKLGTILAAGPKRTTVYLFEADKGGKSHCSGACAKAWPPVVTSGHAQAAGHAVPSDLGTIKRSDGRTQVTYKGHPLYWFEGDTNSASTSGEGSKAFGAGWYVMRANGSKVDDD
jgi:predicted lipoprotein with Yx(FWY)xxD motif